MEYTLNNNNKKINSISTCLPILFGRGRQFDKMKSDCNLKDDIVNLII